MLLKLTIFFPLIFVCSVTAQKLDDDITLEKKPLVILPAKNHYNKNIASKIRGKSGESSTQTNINKQKKANTTPNRGLKIKKTERSSRKNTNKDYSIPRIQISVYRSGSSRPSESTYP